MNSAFPFSKDGDLCTAFSGELGEGGAARKDREGPCGERQAGHRSAMNPSPYLDPKCITMALMAIIMGSAIISHILGGLGKP